MKTRSELLLLADLLAEWPPGNPHWRSEAMRLALVTRHPDRWGPTERIPRGLSTQRIGRYLGRTLGIRTVRITHANGQQERVYLHADLLKVAQRLGMAPPEVTDLTDLTDLTAPAS